MVSYPTKDINAVIIPESYAWPTDMFILPEWAKPFLDSVLIPNGMINDRAEKLAQEIYNTYRDETELTFVVIMSVNDYTILIGIRPIL